MLTSIFPSRKKCLHNHAAAFFFFKFLCGVWPFWCVWVILATYVWAEPIQTEIVTGERAPSRMRPISPSPKPFPSPEKPFDRLIEQMDVYALSPYALHLALPRMVPVQLVQQHKKSGKPLFAPAALREFIRRAAVAHDLDEALIAAVIQVESNFVPTALSGKGARGLMQLMPGTWNMLGVRDPYDPEANILAGCAYLRQQLNRFATLELALAAYNAGPGNVLRYGGVPPFAETRHFVARILEQYRKAHPR